VVSPDAIDHFGRNDGDAISTMGAASVGNSLLRT
jgi:hypothetical protein